MRRLVTYLLLLIPLVGLIDGILEINRVRRVPSLKDWEQAARIVRKGYQKGDIVCFVPYWADQGRHYFAGMHIDAAEELDPTELLGYSRVWFVASMSGLPFHLPKGFAPLIEHHMKKIWVVLARPQGIKSVYSLFDDINHSTLVRMYKNPKQCRNFLKGRWYCDAVHDWQFVGQAIRDTIEGPKEVIWAHPLDHGLHQILTYHDVPLGDFLEFHYGWSLRAIESTNGANLHIKVLWDDHLLLDGVLDKKNHKWNRVQLPLPKDQKPRTHTIRIEWWTPNFKDRQLLFKGWVFRKAN